MVLGLCCLLEAVSLSHACFFELQFWVDLVGLELELIFEVGHHQTSV